MHTCQNCAHFSNVYTLVQIVHTCPICAHLSKLCTLVKIVYTCPNCTHFSKLCTLVQNVHTCPNCTHLSKLYTYPNVSNFTIEQFVHTASLDGFAVLVIPWFYTSLLLLWNCWHNSFRKIIFASISFHFHRSLGRQAREALARVPAHAASALLFLLIDLLLGPGSVLHVHELVTYREKAGCSLFESSGHRLSGPFKLGLLIKLLWHL